MDQVVLNTNLKYVLSGLNMEQRGELFTAVLEEEYKGFDEMVKNLYFYIHDEAENFAKQRRRMQEMGKKSALAKAKKNSIVATALKQCLLRKEAKEDLNINNNINLFSKKNNTKADENNQEFIAPSIDDVREFVLKNELKVDPKVFVDFYESHGWMVGRTAIKNWQATVRLWHSRQVEKGQNNNEQKIFKRQDDESYWSQLKERLVVSHDKETLEEVEILEPPKSLSFRQNVAVCQQEKLELDLSQQPFERFMNRVKKYDIDKEGDNEQTK